MEVTVVICTYNRDQHIERALNSLIEQDFSASDYEIVVVSNGSTDNTSLLVDKFKKKYGDSYNIVFERKEKNTGLSDSRNKGIELARGKIVAYMDDDAIADKNYLSNIKKYTDAYPEYYAFGGKVLPIYETGEEPKWINKYLARIISIVDWGNEIKEIKDSYPVGCNMFFRKELFSKVGGFNNDLKTRADDKYIFFKIRQKGYKILYVPQVKVDHYIEAFRVTLDYIKKISYSNGESDYIFISSLEKNKTKLLFRGLDYTFKIAASVVLWVGYAIKGESIKGKALFLSMYSAFKGFLRVQANL